MKKNRRKRSKTRVLVLNADFSPLALIDWKRALVLCIINESDPSKGLVPIDFYTDKHAKSCGNQKFVIPSVVRSPNYIRQKGRKIPFSRKNIFLRDNLTCMYCGEQDITGENLTFDHVIPRAIWKNQNHRGTPTTWTNIVTCCKSCNRKKANMTPKQANMNLLKEPKEPNIHQYILGISPWTRIEESWEPYLPAFYKNLLKKRKK
jgi:5-methylcytosine-specific restriction endonuclease McrA